MDQMKLNVKRLSEAPRYDAPNHFDVRALRLQGLDAGGAEKVWVGLSHFLPEGGAGPDAGGLEKIYIMLSGEMVLRAQGQEITLRAMDSVTIPAHVEREIRNEGKTVATMLVVMPTPAKEAP